MVPLAHYILNKGKTFILYKMVKASRTIQKPDKNVWSLNGSKQDG
jgi:hypothetical protein